MAELSKAKLANLEEDFRSYKKLPRKMAAALIAEEWKPSDVNAWIKGAGHQEKALNDLIRKEKNKSYTYYATLYDDITNAYEQLSEDLQQLVDDYLWGEFDYMSWSEIAKATYCSTAGIYKKRHRILEKLAIERGILLKVE
ncbi:transcriptional regulator [Enterococcus sp. AZ109]|uniref:transcriptional regulator n=1 Tax=Enterococcus sp. AZ109 TaxID=2774634 RepID=UPI003F25AC51